MSIKEDAKVKKLLASFGKVELFLDQRGEPYIALTVSGAYHVMAIGKREFRQLLISRAFAVTREILRPAKITWVISYLEAKAIESGRRIRLANRFAQRKGQFLLDLADRKRRAVIVTAEGRRLVRLRRIVFKRWKIIPPALHSDAERKECSDWVFRG